MDRNELRYALGWAWAVLLITCVPYVWVWWPTPIGTVFPWVLFNSDDHGVYFSWMRQARDGEILFRNLFTTEPQRGAYFHAYFLLLGWISRLPGLDIPLAYHLGRIVCGVVTLVLAYRFAAHFTQDLFARRCAFWTTAVSGGVGWLAWADRAGRDRPVDVWQPEALVYPSLYANGLFAVSLALMLGVVLLLLRAEEGGWRWAVGAGVCGLALGNIHSYDTLHLAVVWSAYLALRWGTERRFPVHPFRMAAVAALVAAPSVGQMAWLYLSEPVFKARADVGTLSPAPHLYLLGFGLLVPLAAWGGRALWRRGGTALLPIAWIPAGLAAAYLPFAFQRKMIMGTHFAVALLAGLAIADLARRVARPAAGAARGKLRGAAGWIAAGTIALLSITSLRYMIRDVHVAQTTGFTSTQIHPVYWPEGHVRTLEWFGRKTSRDAALLTFPSNGVMVPAWSGRAVYAGHWGETPQFQSRLREVIAFYRGAMTSDERAAFLRASRVTHVLLGPAEKEYIAASVQRGEALPGARPLDREPFLHPVFSSGDTVLLEVR